jgi:hypothetical protein
MPIFFFALSPFISFELQLILTHGAVSHAIIMAWAWQ